MRFEWDERKRLSNLAKHGLDLLDADLVFRGPCYSYPSARQDQVRGVTVGMLDGQEGFDRLDGTRRCDPSHLLPGGAA